MQLDTAERPADLSFGQPGPSRTPFRRLRRVVPAPTMRRGGWSNYLARLAWLFG